jgi:hypothetical protein
MKERDGWVLLSGVITVLLGLLIFAHWPVSSLYILGVFLSIDLIMAGAVGEWSGSGTVPSGGRVGKGHPGEAWSHRPI